MTQFFFLLTMLSAVIGTDVKKLIQNINKAYTCEKIHVRYQVQTLNAKGGIQFGLDEEYVSDGKNFYTSSGDHVSVITTEFFISINKYARQIIVSDKRGHVSKAASFSPFPSVVMADSLINRYVTSAKISESAGKGTLRIEYKNTDIQFLQMHFDKETHMVSSCEYKIKGYGGKISHCRIVYNTINTREVDKKYFNSKEYFTRTKGKLTGTGEYAGFTVIDKRK